MLNTPIDLVLICIKCCLPSCSKIQFDFNLIVRRFVSRPIEHFSKNVLCKKGLNLSEADIIGVTGIV